MRFGVLILGPVSITWGAIAWMTSFPDPDSESDVTIPAGLPLRLESHVKTLATDIGERNAYVEGSLERSLAYIENQAAERGLALEHQTFAADGYDFANLHGAIGGDGKTIVLGAHYDTSPGT